MDRVNELRKDTQRNELVDRATLRYAALKDHICVMARIKVRYPLARLEQALVQEKVLEHFRAMLERCMVTFSNA